MMAVATAEAIAGVISRESRIPRKKTQPSALPLTGSAPCDEGTGNWISDGKQS